MLNLNQLLSNTSKPELYAPGSATMWDDVHIAQQMLKAHLNPEVDGASRKHAFINRSVEWIEAQLTPNSTLLDLGCGPGLYCQPLSANGHRVTGVDFSKNSIAYAAANAQQAGLQIEYLYKDYLELAFDKRFDLVLLIFCDFGALSLANQQLLLGKINGLLAPGGKLIFDVFSPAYFEQYEEATSWNVQPAGFWRPHPHLVLEQKLTYPAHMVTLEQYQLIDEHGMALYRNWNKCFTEAEITGLLHQHGFGNVGVYADVAGSPAHAHSETLGLVAEKS